MKRYIDADKLKEMVNRQYSYCHGYTGTKKDIYREALLAVKSAIHCQSVSNDMQEVVRCQDCKYFQDRYVELPDGSKRPYKKGESGVPLSVGINVGSYCTRIDYAIVHGYRYGEPSVDETRLWTKPDDFCSHGERKDKE